MLLRLTMTAASFLFLPSGSAVWAQGPAKEQALPDKVWDVMRGAKQIDVFALDPAGQDVFVGEWKYLGKSTASGAAVRKELTDALLEGVKKADQNKRKGKFVPRYGVRATSGGTTVEMLIDFELGEIHLFLGKERGVIRTSGSPNTFFEKLFEV